MEWVSVKARLPDKDGKYLVVQRYFGFRTMAVVNFSLNLFNIDEYEFNEGESGFYEYDDEYGNYLVSNISHWSELPEMPSETICRYRFKTKAEDFRPLKDMKDIQMPWWCTGEATDGSYSTIVCYLPWDKQLFEYWDDAYDIDCTEETEIRYSDRFPKPKWIE